MKVTLSPVRIVLVDDHEVVREGLKALIEMMGPYKIIASFGNGRELIQALPLEPAPDLIILDLIMPVMDGISTMKWIKEQSVSIPVLVLSAENQTDTINECADMQVNGYLAKFCNSGIIKHAIDDIVQYGYHTSDLMLQAGRNRDTRKEAANRKIKEKLTSRELEFLKLLCAPEDHTYKAIAHLMNVSRSTVDGYRESLFKKLNVNSKTGLYRFATENKLV
jgi:two-component system invasion response regulator UvrY